MTDYQIFEINWNDIEVTIRFKQCYSQIFKRNYGYNMSHIEVLTANTARLPITSTGYISHFVLEQFIAEHGTAVQYVIDWLDKEAKSKDWHWYLVDTAQYELF